MTQTIGKALVMEEHNDQFILIPAKSGGGALLRRSQIAGGRANGADGAIVYLACGPSVYTTATIPQLAEYLGAHKVMSDNQVDRHRQPSWPVA
ncbi:hypothetical protein [Ruegeria sp.]|uniref:hypothetical protein n=1 Tax=Ruegeria sp. TaxID=1879320 RepID=UPI003B5C7D65